MTSSSDTQTITVPEFGHWAPGGFGRLLIEGARRNSFSRPLHPLSSFCRKLFLLVQGERPVDYHFQRARVRFRPKRNLAERRCLLKPAAFDPLEFVLIRRWLPVGGVFLDVGANVGLYALSAAGICGRQGRVLAFEPNALVYARLCENIALNRGRASLAEILPLQLAITGKNGPVSFVQPQDNQGEGRVATAADMANTLEVEGKTLATVLEEQGIGRVDVLKIDIEGHEYVALQPFLENAPESLHPHVLIIERGDQAHWESLAGLLRQAGYLEVAAGHMNVILKKQGSGEDEHLGP